MGFPFFLFDPHTKGKAWKHAQLMCICFGLLSLNSIHDTVKLDTMHCLYHPDQVSFEKNPDTSV